MCMFMSSKLAAGYHEGGLCVPDMLFCRTAHHQCGLTRPTHNARGNLGTMGKQCSVNPLASSITRL
jgi:hypothetical protein